MFLLTLLHANEVNFKKRLLQKYVSTRMHMIYVVELKENVLKCLVLFESINESPDSIAF